MRSIDPAAEVEEVVAAPVKLVQAGDGSEPRSRHEPRSAAPRLGAHTERVLREEVGLSGEQMAKLKASGVFGSAD